MKELIKTIGIFLVALVLIAGGYKVYAAVVTPLFPTTANDFTEGEVIEEEDWNAIENTIGTTATTSKLTLFGRWNDLFASTTLPQITTLLNLTSTGALNAGSISSGFGNINIGTDVFTGADLNFSGELLPDGSTCSNGEILKKTGTNDWDCAADSTGSGAAFPFTATSYGVSTSTTIGLLNGFLSTASSTINASTTITGVLTASGGVFGNLTGTASLATALGANGANCSAGNSPLGVDASGAVESCFDAWTEAENTSAAYTPQSRTLTVAGTAGQITSSAGAQDLTANRTWTLSLPTFVQISDLTVTRSTTTYATTTSATSTSFFATTASTTNFYGADLSTCDATTGKLTWASGKFGCGTDFNSGGSSFGKTLELVSSGDFLSATSSPYKSFVIGATTTASLDKTALFQVNATGTTGTLIKASSTTSFIGKFLDFTRPDGTSILSFASNGNDTLRGGREGGGNFDIFGADAVTTNTDAGNLFLAGGGGNGTGLGGEVTVFGGGGGSTSGSGGGATLQGGTGGAPNGNGGNVSIIGGTKQGGGTASKVYLKSDGSQSNYAILDTTLIASTDKTFTFPNQTGTLCLVGVACDGNSSSKWATSTGAWANAIYPNSGNTNTLVGIGTSTPMYQLTIASSTGPQLSLSSGSGFAQWAFRNAGGNFYLATSSPTTFATSTTNAFSIDSTNTVTFGNSNATCIALTGSSALCDGTDADSGGGGAPDTKWATTTSTLNPNAIFPNSGNNNTLVGIGTSTPMYQLGIASSTGPQLSLTDTGGFAQWAFRNAGGNLYFATTTVAGTATSSPSALTIIGSSGNVGIGTSSPFAKLSIQQGAGEVAFAIGSSTNTSFVVDKKGYVGIGSATTTNQAQGQLTIRASGVPNVEAGIFAYYYGSGATVGNSRLSLHRARGTLESPTAVSSGDRLYVMNGLGYDGNSYVVAAQILADVEGTVASGIVPGLLGFYTRNTAGTLAERLRVTPDGNVGIGITTPAYTLTVASTTGPQLALSSGTSFAQWAFRNAGGNLYFSTTTVAGTATTSIAALVIENDGGLIIPSINAGAAGDTDACLDATTNELKDAGATACIVSSIRFKENLEPLTDSLSKILKLNPTGFTYKEELDSSPIKGKRRIGLIAEDMELIEPRLVNYESDGVTPRGIDYESYTALITDAIIEFYREFKSVVNDLIAWNKDQDESLKRLEEENRELKARIENLEAKIK